MTIDQQGKTSSGTGLALYWLGAPVVELKGRRIELETRKAAALLAYLSLEKRTISRETLAALFWPEYDSSRALGNLRRSLWSLNKSLGPDWLDAGQDKVGIRSGTDLWIDVDAFLKEAESRSGDLEKAVELYRGDFLEGLNLKDCPDFDDWQFFQREGLRRSYAEALEKLAQAHAARDSWEAAIGYARHWVALDRLHEPAQRLLIDLFGCAGQKSAAARQYEGFVELLEAELGAEPEAATTRVYREAVEGKLEHVESKSTPAAAVAPAVPAGPEKFDNLPFSPGQFFGRTREMDQIEALLDDPACRLLTVTGPGGMGKTRLTIEAARRQKKDFEHGVCFVALASVNSPSMLLGAVAEALRFSFYQEGDALEQLGSFLSEKELLLVMDNFEHLKEAAPVLVDLLGRAAGIKFLVSSRESLEQPGEWLLSLDGLPYPESQDLENLETYGAVELFLQSARQVSVGFSLKPADRQYVVEICKMVDGTPLGIELAASWLRLLSCEEIAAEIERSLEFLEAPGRGVPERHQSLKVVFEHSWDLLSGLERSALMKLSVFHGSFSRQAAAQVAGANLGVLSSLVNKSLVKRNAAGNFTLHQLIKQFSAGKLEDNSNAHRDALETHALYFMNRLKTLGDALRGPQQGEAIFAIGAEMQDIQAGWFWALEYFPPGELYQLYLNFCNYYLYNGYPLEQSLLFWKSMEIAERRYQARTHLQEETLLHEMIKCSGGSLAYGYETQEQSLQRMKEVHAVVNELPMSFPVATIKMMGNYWFDIIGGEKALETLDACLQFYRENGYRWEEANCYTVAVNILMTEGYNIEETYMVEEYCRKSLEVYRDLGDYFGQSIALNTQAFLNFFAGSLEKAHQISLENLKVLEMLPSRGAQADPKYTLGQILTSLGEYEQAAQFFKENIEYLKSVGNKHYLAQHYDCLGYCEYERERWEDAEKYARLALPIYTAMGDLNGIGMAYGNLGDAQRGRDDTEAARQSYQKSMEYLKETNNTWGIAKTYKNLGYTSYAEGKYSQAQDEFTSAFQYVLQTERIWEVMEITFGMGQVMYAQQNWEKALEFLGEAAAHPACKTKLRRKAEAMLVEVKQHLGME